MPTWSGWQKSKSCFISRLNMKESWNRNKVSAVLRVRALPLSARMLLLFAFTLSLAACHRTSDNSRHVNVAAMDSVEYYCPMHPGVRQSTPGKCPKPECAGMVLVKKEPDYLRSALKPV